LLAVALNVLFAIAAAAIWTNHFASWKVKCQKREGGYLRDEIQIDPTNVASIHTNLARRQIGRTIYSAQGFLRVARGGRPTLC